MAEVQAPGITFTERAITALKHIRQSDEVSDDQVLRVGAKAVAVQACRMS